MISGFQDRQDAGQVLARELSEYCTVENLLVLGLPRGGVPVAFEVARELKAQLDIMLVRKLGVPGHEEYAMGAIASGGVKVLDQSVVNSLGISMEQVDQVYQRELAELQRREQVYREGREPPVIKGRTVILVDDGIATGSSMKAAVKALRSQHPEKIVVAVPAAPDRTPLEFKDLVDEFISVLLPSHFYAVGQWYAVFGQTTDEEVIALLKSAYESWQRGWKT